MLKNKTGRPIKFGTDGFRGIIAKEFTYREVEIISFAVADYLFSSRMAPDVNIGFDRRFMSDRFAAFMANVLNAIGVSVEISSGPVPTPAISRSVISSGASLGLMITASHNSYEYNGVKIKTGNGATASSGVIAEIQKRVDIYGESGVDAKKFRETFKIENNGTTTSFDPLPGYLEGIKKSINIEMIRNFADDFYLEDFTFLINPMHGASAGLFEKFIDSNGLEIYFEEIFSDHNPLFPGFNPEPIASNMKTMMETMKESDESDDPYFAGFCFDGDGDRIAAVRSDGSFVSPQTVFSLIFYHMVKSGKLDGAIAKTVSVTSMIDKIAGKFGVKVYETPIGFKYIAELMQNPESNVAIGGEESGGVGITSYMPERDGLFLSMLLIEAMAREGKNIDELIEDLDCEFGKHYYDRNDYHFSAEKFEEVKKTLAEKPLREICDLKVASVKDFDGYKYILSDGSWILFRFSGTEPVLRIYAESHDEGTVASLLGFAGSYLKIN